MNIIQKTSVVTIITVAAGITIYQMKKGPDAARGGAGIQLLDSAVLRNTASSRIPDGVENGNPPHLSKPLQNDAGNDHLQHNLAGVLSTPSKKKGSHDDDDQMVPWKDPEEARACCDGGASKLGVEAARILLSEGKDAMRRFLDAHQQDPELRPKDQGELEKYMLYELGSAGKYDEAMKLLADSTNASEMAGMMISGIKGTENKTKAIDYMEAKGIPVDFDYWMLQDNMGEDPRYWADWALQRGSDMLPEIVDAWARGHMDEAKAWVAERVPKDDKHRAEIDELMQIREAPIPADEPESNGQK